MAEDWPAPADSSGPTSSAPRLRLTGMSPACEVRLALRAPDGLVHARTRLCWAHVPQASEVVAVLAGWACEARRRGLRPEIEAAPGEVLAVLALAGLERALLPMPAG